LQISYSVAAWGQGFRDSGEGEGEGRERGKVWEEGREKKEESSKDKGIKQEKASSSSPAGVLHVMADPIFIPTQLKSRGWVYKMTFPCHTHLHT
jgi:hypothetical protein